jgi:hypothetical protein
VVTTSWSLPPSQRGVFFRPQRCLTLAKTFSLPRSRFAKKCFLRIGKNVFCQSDICPGRKKEKKGAFFSPNFSVDAPQGTGETPYVPHETPHELQETSQVPQGEVHVPHRGELFAKSRAAFLAAGFVSALRSVGDSFHTLAACATKVSPPLLRGTLISQVLAERVFLPVSEKTNYYAAHCKKLFCPIP